jgi:peptide chain release factor 1
MTTQPTLVPDAVLARARALVAERDEVERALADPAVHDDPARAKALGRRYTELGGVAGVLADLEQTLADHAAAVELGTEDAGFAAEAEQLREQAHTLAERLQVLLLPRDPDDGRDAMLEIKAGEGGAESALFAGDLLRMYSRYAERRGWRVELLDEVRSDLGGVSSATIAVRARPGTAAPDAPFARLKYEGGVHRVQRVPVTESAGRIHTSAAGVLVAPEADDVTDVVVDPNDLRIDVFRSSGPGGQSVNTTDSAVRITHLPTGIVVSCQNEKSQLQNREQALRILRARLLACAREEAERTAAAERRSQVRTVDRSERIRTYNFPENRITDHRVNYKAYTLAQVLDGDLDAVVQACVDADHAARLRGVEVAESS